MTREDHKARLSFALSDKYRAEFCRAVIESINAAATAETSEWAAAAPKTDLKIGDAMEDGTIYAGVSPDTGKAMYTTPADASGTYTFNEAARYAKQLSAHGHKDWRVPSKNELNMLWENRNKGKLKGKFAETGSYPAGWYWSSSPYNNSGWPEYDNHYGWAQRFSDGKQYDNYRDHVSFLRCVR